MYQTSIFTFHYVSIKSQFHVHSEYSLLEFTFHYVSIKSPDGLPCILPDSYLHSTMYLLNPRIATPYHFSSLFSIFLSTYHHTMLNHMYTSPSSFILRITTILSMSLYFYDFQVDNTPIIR